MALTITFNDDNAVDGDKRIRRGLITFDNSYPTGGEPLVPADFKLNVIESIKVDSVSRGGTRFVTPNGFLTTLQVWTALSTEAGNGTDQSSVNVTFEAVGY